MENGDLMRVYGGLMVNLGMFAFIWVCLKMLCTPLYPMVLLIIIPMKNDYFIGNIPYFQTNPYGDILWKF